MSVDISCDCGKCLRVSEDKRGKRIKCPGCGEVIRIPDVDDAQDEFTEEPAPRVRPAKSRKKKGKAKGGSPLVPISIVGGLALIGTAVVGVVLLWPRRPVAQPEVAAMPTGVIIPVEGKGPPPKETLTTTESWQPFQHLAGGFSVDVPGTLRRVKQREEAGSEFYGIQIPGKRPYACYVEYTPIPIKSTAGKPTSHILQVAAKTYSETGPITEQSDLQYRGQEGLEFRRVGKNNRPRRSRLFFHHNAVIEFSVMWEKEEPIAERDRFWNSIQFTP